MDVVVVVVLVCRIVRFMPGGPLLWEDVFGDFFGVLKGWWAAGLPWCVFNSR